MAAAAAYPVQSETTTFYALLSTLTLQGLLRGPGKVWALHEDIQCMSIRQNFPNQMIHSKLPVCVLLTLVMVCTPTQCLWG